MGDIERAAYKQQKAVLEAELSTFVLPEQKAITEAGRYLNQVGALWDDADVGPRRELLHAILESVKVDVLARHVICVEAKPEFVPLFRQVKDLEENDGCFYIKGEVGPACQAFLAPLCGDGTAGGEAQGQDGLAGTAGFLNGSSGGVGPRKH